MKFSGGIGGVVLVWSFVVGTGDHDVVVFASFGNFVGVGVDLMSTAVVVDVVYDYVDDFGGVRPSFARGGDNSVG